MKLSLKFFTSVPICPVELISNKVPSARIYEQDPRAEWHFALHWNVPPVSFGAIACVSKAGRRESLEQEQGRCSWAICSFVVLAFATRDSL